MNTKCIIFSFISTVFLFIVIIYFGIQYIFDKQEKRIKDDLKQPNQEIIVKFFEFNNDTLQLKIKNVNNNKIFNNKKKLVLINFWASTCAPCVAEMPSLIKLAETNEIDVVFINYENKERQKKFITKNSYNINLFYKPYDKLPKVFDHPFIPYTYILNTKKGLGFKIEGAINWNDKLLHKLINNL